MPTITDIEGNTYNTVQIGSQCWMAENLKTTTYRNGTQIPNVTNSDDWFNLTTGTYVWYNNDISWKNSYGALYNWYATNDANGLCPAGWSLPAHDEWNALIDFIGGTNSPHGSELKSCRQVNSLLGGACNTTEHPRWNEHDTHYGTNNFGFSGLPGGYRNNYGTFYSISNSGSWWTSMELTEIDAWYYQLFKGHDYVYFDYYDKREGRSVRCVRD